MLMFQLVFVSVIVLPNGHSSVPGPVAMVLTTKGNVTLQRGKHPPRRFGAMTLLQPDDHLGTPADGEATFIFLADGQRERLKPKAQVTVGPKGCTPPDAIERLKTAKLPPANLESLRDLANSSRGAVGVLRGDPPPKPQVVTPLFGATIQTDRPSPGSMPRPAPISCSSSAAPRAKTNACCGRPPSRKRV